MAHTCKKTIVDDGVTIKKSDISRAIAQKLDVEIGQMQLIVDEIFDYLGQAILDRHTIKLTNFGTFKPCEYYYNKTRYINGEKVFGKELVRKTKFETSEKIDDILNRKWLCADKYKIDPEIYINWNSELK